MYESIKHWWIHGKETGEFCGYCQRPIKTLYNLGTDRTWGDYTTFDWKVPYCGLCREDERIARLRNMPYTSYLRSSWWQHVKREVLSEDHRMCQRCKRYQEDYGFTLDVHHKTYKRRGMEKREDLETVCRDCHKSIHNRD